MVFCPGHEELGEFSLGFYVCFEIKTPGIDVRADMKRNGRQAVQWTTTSMRRTTHKEQVKIMYIMQMK